MSINLKNNPIDKAISGKDPATIKEMVANAFFSSNKEETKENKNFLKYSKIMFWLIFTSLFTCILSAGIGCGINDKIVGNWAFILKRVILSITAAFNFAFIGVAIYYLTLLHPKFNAFNRTIKTCFNILITIIVFMVLASCASIAMIIAKDSEHNKPYYMIPVLLTNLGLFLILPIALGIVRSFKLQKMVFEASKK